MSNLIFPGLEEYGDGGDTVEAMSYSPHSTTKAANTLDVFSDRQSANFNRQSAKTVGLVNTLIGPGGSHVDKELRKKSIALPHRLILCLSSAARGME